MKIIRKVLGELDTNCYILLDETTREAAVVDPADGAPALRAALEAEGAALRYILLTHGHRDHTLAAPALHALYPDAAAYIHPADKNGAGIYHYPPAELIPGLRYYDDGDALPLGTLTVEVLHTPGHTGGSVCLQCGDALFTGDTLFAGSIGRLDLPGATPEKMPRSLKRLAALDGDRDVYPGHMETTTLARERQGNPYLRML